ncbi:MAG: TIGR03619 family F420-dependent LLM class oxidoreductase [Candidatus Hodarchaeota archaeon]
MNLGYVLENFGDSLNPDSLVETAQMAEDHRFSSIWATDHVLPPINNPFPQYNNITEAITTISYLAGITSKISLGVSTLVLTRRHPILVAKQIANLDYLTKGRILISFGAGLTSGEFEFMDQSFSNRGKRFDEGLEVVKSLWEGKHTFHGNYYTFTEACFKPLPHNSRKIPIWVAGNSKFALERALKRANGWHPTSMQAEDIKAMIEPYRKSLLENEFTIAVRISVNGESDLSHEIQGYENNNVDYLLLKILGGKKTKKRIFAELSSYT